MIKYIFTKLLKYQKTELNRKQTKLKFVIYFINMWKKIEIKKSNSCNMMVEQFYKFFVYPHNDKHILQINL